MLALDTKPCHKRPSEQTVEIGVFTIVQSRTLAHITPLFNAAEISGNVTLNTMSAMRVSVHCQHAVVDNEIKGPVRRCSRFSTQLRNTQKP